MLRYKAAPESKKEHQDARKWVSPILDATNNAPSRGPGWGVGGEVTSPLGTGANEVYEDKFQDVYTP